MSASLAVLVIVSIILTIITLLSLTVIYQLYLHLCCHCCLNKQQEAASSSSTSMKHIPSTSASKSQTMSGNNSKSNSNKSTKPIIPFFKNTTLTACTMFVVVSIIINIDRILSNQPYWSIIYVAIVTPIFYFVGQMVLSLIFIARLYYTFHGSSFEYSQCTMRSLMFSWCLMPLFAFIAVVIYPISIIICIMFGTLFILIDIILSCVLLYLYMKQLSILVNGNKENRDDHEKLISLMTRYTLLYSICFTSTAIHFVVSSMSFLDIAHPVEELRFLYILMSIDGCFNSFALWFNLPFGRDWYFKICGYCHTKCKQCYGASDDELMVQNISSSDAPVQTTTSDHIETKSPSTPSMMVDTTMNTAVIF